MQEGGSDVLYPTGVRLDFVQLDLPTGFRLSLAKPTGVYGIEDRIGEKFCVCDGEGLVGFRKQKA